jgi:hypothetical protein
MAGMSSVTPILETMAKKKPTKPKKRTVKKQEQAFYNDEQFEAHVMDSIAKDIKKWNIPWFVGVMGKPNSDDIKIVVAGTPFGETKQENKTFVKSILTLSAMSIEDLLKDGDASYDFYDI